MSVYSLIVCDRCGAQLRVSHVVSPRPAARAKDWITLVMPDRTDDFCPTCDGETDW